MLIKKALRFNFSPYYTSYSMKHLYSLIAFCAAFAPWASAQVVTTTPAIIQQDTQNIVITFHADQGNKGLMGVKPPTKVYAHTGVITNLSTSGSDWQYAPSWGDNSSKYELTYVDTNTWTLSIPDIDTYYGVPAGVTVKQLAFVFRTGDCSKEGKTESGGDIFVDVMAAGFQVALTSSQGSVVDGNPVTFTANTTYAANIAIYLDSTSSTPLASGTGVTTLEATYTFATPGDYEVIAVATAGNDTQTASMRVTRLADPIAKEFPGGVPKMGYTKGDDGSTIFCLGAPSKKQVVIVGSWDDYEVLAENSMYYQDYEGYRYFWKPIYGLQDGTDYIYYYLIDGTTRVGDPYARLVLDPYNDKWISSSVFPNLPAYPVDKVQNVPLAIYNTAYEEYDWKCTDFQRIDQSDLLIYELLIRDFTGTEGVANGEGTLKGVMGKLDYLQGLGVNAIELLPIMEFNGNNSWGYNTNFYFAPDKAYGTPDEYKALIDECHARGMAVILDIVFNQSDGLHPWYQMYEIAKNPFYNGSAPHAYSVLNDWNQDNPLVAQQWADCVQYWLTVYNVDGFRFDLVKGLGNNNSYDNTYYPATNTWGTPSDANTNKYNATRVARMKVIHDAMREVDPTAYFINENLATAEEENDMAKDGETNWANVNYASCQFAMGFSSGSGLERFYAPLDSRTWGSTVSYAESHDEERMAYKQAEFGTTGVKGDTEASMRRLGSVAAQMLMCPGAHMIWQFQEFGADQTTKESSGGNDTSPKKVIWSYLDDPQHAGLHQSYVELLHLRGDNPQLFKEGVTTTINISQSNWAAGRSIKLSNGTSELLMVVNPMPSTVRNLSVGFTKDYSQYKLMSASYGFTPEVSETGTIAVPAGGYAVYGTLDLSGVESIPVDATAATDSDTTATYYNLQGIQVTNPTPGGIYIVRRGGKVTKEIVL